VQQQQKPQVTIGLRYRIISAQTTVYTVLCIWALGMFLFLYCCIFFLTLLLLIATSPCQPTDLDDQHHKTKPQNRTTHIDTLMGATSVTIHHPPLKVEHRARTSNGKVGDSRRAVEGRYFSNFLFLYNLLRMFRRLGTKKAQTAV
jgi:hypothetical protein